MEGVPKKYFNAILEYILSDHFTLVSNNIEFFLRLLVYADYFMLPRLVEVCSTYLKTFVTNKTALTLLMFAMTHNAE